MSKGILECLNTARCNHRLALCRKPTGRNLLSPGTTPCAQLPLSHTKYTTDGCGTGSRHGARHPLYAATHEHAPHLRRAGGRARIRRRRRAHPLHAPQIDPRKDAGGGAAGGGGSTGGGWEPSRTLAVAEGGWDVHHAHAVVMRIPRELTAVALSMQQEKMEMEWRRLLRWGEWRARLHACFVRYVFAPFSCGSTDRRTALPSPPKR